MEWLLLAYKLPSEPTRLRAAIWRKLKMAGAVYLQDGVAMLPAEPVFAALLAELARDIQDMRGTAYLMTCVPVSQPEALLEVFNAARVAEYAEFVGRCNDFHAELAKERAVQNFTFVELEENEDELAKLVAWLAKVQGRDHFGVPARAEAEAALAACRDDLEHFEREVHAAEHVSE